MTHKCPSAAIRKPHLSKILHVEDIRHSIEESRADGKVVPADKVFEALEARIMDMTRRLGR